MRLPGRALTLVLALPVSPAELAAQTRPAEPESTKRVIREEITPSLRLAVSRGLDYLIRTQRETNSFTTAQFPVAANALMGLALLAGGYTDSTGPAEYVEALKASTTRLLSYQEAASGYFDDGESRMYGHGFATLYLAELYGTSTQQDEAIRKALVQAIRLIERSQGKEGGWDYLPGGSGPLQSKFGGGDTSITVCQTMALRAARNLGIAVDPHVIQNAKKYIQKAQQPDGGFAYRLGEHALKNYSEFPRSAAGVCILYSLGEYSGSSIRRGVAYLNKNYRKLNDFPHYAHYYCGQAMFQVGGRYWKEYFSWASREFIDTQRADGSWKAGTYETSVPVRTAMALVVLQLPYRFLPIHER